MKKIIVKTFLKNTVLAAFLTANLVLAVLLIMNSKAVVSLTLEAGAIQDKRDALRKAKVTVRDFNEQKLRREESSLKVIFVDQPVPLEALKELVRIAKASGISRVNIAQDQGGRNMPNLSGAKAVPVKVKFGAKYRTILAFLSGVSDSPVLMNVRSLKILRDNKKMPELDVDITVDTFGISTKDKPSPEALPGSMPGSSSQEPFP